MMLRYIANGQNEPGVPERRFIVQRVNAQGIQKLL